jgi:hypothetical protein
MGLYLSIGAECQDTDTKEPSFDTATLAERAQLGTSVCHVICVDGSVGVAGGDGGGDGASFSWRSSSSHPIASVKIRRSLLLGIRSCTSHKARNVVLSDGPSVGSDISFSILPVVGPRRPQDRRDVGRARRVDLQSMLKCKLLEADGVGVPDIGRERLFERPVAM